MLAVFRVLGWILLLPATGVVGWELTMFAETGHFQLYSLGELWSEVHPNSLTAFKGVLERHVSASLWDKGVAPLLLREAVLVVTLPGFILVALPWLVDQIDRATEPSDA